MSSMFLLLNHQETVLHQEIPNYQRYSHSRSYAYPDSPVKYLILLLLLQVPQLQELPLVV
jgi:hypothetical protein